MAINPDVKKLQAILDRTNLDAHMLMMEFGMTSSVPVARNFLGIVHAMVQIAPFMLAREFQSEDSKNVWRGFVAMGDNIIDHGQDEIDTEYVDPVD